MKLLFTGVVLFLMLLSITSCFWFKPNYVVIDKRTILYHNQLVSLNFPLKDGKLSEVDKSLLDAVDTPPSRPIRRVLLDPGHGGKAVGAVGKVYQEKNLNFAVALSTFNALEQAGFEVIMTRDSDIDLSLATRAQKSKASGADILISIHHNARDKNTIESGIESYTLTAPMALSSGSLGTEPKPATIGNAFDIDSFRLAFELQKLICQTTKAPNRGVKHARFAVLAQAECPAVLLEIGFISTPSEELELGTSERHQQVAEAIRDGLLSLNRRLR